jgi:hypothetical protein|tara:strand:+ start:1586 stop:1882 length:297 start_codon:yes stop_codon:yes gene_type:complete
MCTNVQLVIWEVVVFKTTHGNDQDRCQARVLFVIHAHATTVMRNHCDNQQHQSGQPEAQYPTIRPKTMTCQAANATPARLCQSKRPMQVARTNSKQSI